MLAIGEAVHQDGEVFLTGKSVLFRKYRIFIYS